MKREQVFGITTGVLIVLFVLLCCCIVSGSAGILYYARFSSAGQADQVKRKIRLGKTSLDRYDYETAKEQLENANSGFLNLKDKTSIDPDTVADMYISLAQATYGVGTRFSTKSYAANTYSEALNYTYMAIRYDKTDFRIYMIKGAISERFYDMEPWIGANLEEAIKYYQTAGTYETESQDKAETLVTIGNAYERLGEYKSLYSPEPKSAVIECFQNALDQYEKAIAMDYQNLRAQEEEKQAKKILESLK